MSKLLTKQELLDKLNAYATTQDDDCVRFKEKIKENLLRCPELLFALNNPDYQSELFNDDDTINYDGDWSMYFGENILPYAFLPDVQTDTGNFLCYNVVLDDVVRHNEMECYMQVWFTILCHSDSVIDAYTGISRQDLISSILRERFNWSNIFGSKCRLIKNKESVIDTRYCARTMVFEMIVPNATTKTTAGVTQTINKKVRK